MKNTDKGWINDLALIGVHKGITHVVISPGSRNAPLVIAFSRHPEIKCLSIIDERSAAFFALGMAQQMGKPVALVCTSGSALLNYAPAVAEAYYQKIPLLILTSDRPKEMIDQGDGQTIRQYEAFRGHILKSFELPVSSEGEEDSWYCNRMVSEALNLCLYPVAGPVHINIPLREPLYGLKHYEEMPAPKIINITPPQLQLKEEDKTHLSAKWKFFKKKMIIAGLMIKREEAFFHEVEKLAEDPSVVVLTETTSNIGGSKTVNCIDSVLEAMPKDKKRHYAPDLLVTFGGEIVSKKLKAYLRTHKPKEHWLIDPSLQHIDTFKSLTNIIGIHPVDFVSMINEAREIPESHYHLEWEGLKKEAEKKSEQFLQSLPFCDLTVFRELLSHIPATSNLHFGNSSSIRYSNLFEIPFEKNIRINCNRGTSGIDGCTSTAAGAAYVNDKLTILITGDLGFLYDSNALFNQHLAANLRIIIINNSGGNIFRIIPGPRDLPELEEFFETTHDYSAEHIAHAFKIPYYFCEDMNSLRSLLNEFFLPDEKPAILEIKTPNKTSAEVLREYMNM